MVKALGGRIEIDDVPLTRTNRMSQRVKQIEILREAERIVNEYEIDYVDALQLLTILKGKYSILIGDSQSVLITADKKLAKAAQREGAQVWNILTESKPVQTF